jgi:hypothetical protein
MLQWSCIIYTLWHLGVDLSKALDTGLPFGEAFKETLGEAPASIVIILLSFIVGMFVTHLFGYHIIVILWQGMSTYESKKDHFKTYVMGNPY